MERSKLVLGTAQLGMAYGINNSSGQPDMEDAFDILDFAWESGITTFDTAAAYGSAETVLGSWIRSRGHSEVFVISKLRSGVKGADIPAELDSSLERLGLDHLDGYMLHSASDMSNAQFLRRFQSIGSTKVSHLGVSVYGPAQAMEAVGLGFDYIQIPYNVFDRRLDRVRFFEAAKERAMRVFARSPFLQGLLLMEPHNIPDHLSRARSLVSRFREIAEKYGVSPLASALLFVLSKSEIDQVVFGVETREQLEEIVSASRLSAPECVFELSESFDEADESIVDPSTWTQRH